jgi:uncharacterized SAM-binding protein YcdF (DUF218 family)
MSMEGKPRTDRTAPRISRRRRLVLAFSALLTACSIVGGVALAGGFLWFVNRVPAEEIVLNRKADGIVVLTGGTSRIADAIALLAAGHGRRLLISGVHPATSSREISRLVPRYERLVDCCVDLDHAAINTVGNAMGARLWARDHHFRSVIVVTSSYHMPRSMAELAHQLPDIELIPFPVVSEKLRTDPWWASLPTVRLLLTEYLKYMVAQVRMRLEPAPGTTDVARARGLSGS